MAASSCEGFSCRVIDGTFDLIEDEKFDFDVPISPPTECDVREASNYLEDEDEVFFGPIGHKERCVTVNSGPQDDDNFKPLSPLNGEQIAELFKEATAVSILLKSQSLENGENEFDEKESRNISDILSRTFTVMEDGDNLKQKPDKENDLRIPTKSVSLPNVISQDISLQSEFSDDIVDPVTPKRVLREKNSDDQPSMTMPSPFKGRKPRPLPNTSKFTSSKLPKTQMTLKTRSCFNSPIKVEHLYGVVKSTVSEDDKVMAENNGTSPAKKRGTRANDGQGLSKGDSSFTESSKLPVPSQSGIKPPGFGAKSRRRRTSSTSSASSTSSVLSQSNSDLNETFTISNTTLSSEGSSIPPACPRKVPVTKATLKPLNGNSAVPKLASGFTKPKGRPQPVKALPQTGNVSTRRALQTTRSLGNMPGQQRGGMTCEKLLDKSQTPSAIQRSKSFTTPKAGPSPIQHQKNSMNSGKPLDGSQTPTVVQRSKSFTTVTPKTSIVKKRSSIFTGQPIKSVQTPSKAKRPELQATPRRRGSATATQKTSLTSVPTPVRKHSSAVEASVTNQAGPVNRPSTPLNDSSVSKDMVTPPNPVPSKVAKRKSLSAGGQKRRSLLPTPLRSGRITRSQSQKAKPSSSDNTSQGALPFNISPSADLAEPKRGLTSGSQVDATLERPQSSSSLSDPFSPASRSITFDLVQDYSGGDSSVRNLIELSPALVTEGKLVDI